MTKSKTTNKILCILVLMLFLTALTMVFFQNDVTLAQTGGEIHLGNIDYRGTQNHCYFDLILKSASITNQTITNTNNFEIYMLGESCNKILPHIRFYFHINFTLLKDNTEVASKLIKFTVEKEKDISDKYNTITVFDKLYGNGKYALVVSGSIQSVATENINYTVNFTVAE